MIAGAKPEAVGILGRREPLAKAGRGGILLVREQLIEVGLLGGRGFEIENDVIEGEVRGDGPEIRLRLREAVNVSGDRREPGGIDGPDDSIRNGALHCKGKYNSQ